MDLTLGALLAIEGGLGILNLFFGNANRGSKIGRWCEVMVLLEGYLLKLTKNKCILASLRFLHPACAMSLSRSLLAN